MLIKERKINLVNIVLILYIFSIIVFNEGTTIIKIVKVFFAGICLLDIIAKRKLYVDKYILWMVVFTFFCVLSVNWAISKENAKDIISTLILNNICNFFIINLIYEDKSRIKTIINCIIFSSIILGFRIAIEYGPLVFVNGSRGGSNGMMSANTIGMVASISSVLCIYFLISQKKHRTLYFVALILNLIITVLSSSRKALLFLIIPLIIYYILHSKNILVTLRKIFIAIIFCIIIFVLIMKVPFLYESVGNRIETMINGFLGEDTDASTELRLKMIEWGLEWFQEKPYLGYGINNYKTLLGEKNTSFGSEGVYAHNNYIELLVDVGIIGTLIYYYIYILIAYKAIKHLKKANLLEMIMFGIFISCVINEYGMVSYYGKFAQLILMLSWMTIVGINNKKHEAFNNE